MKRLYMIGCLLAFMGLMWACNEDGKTAVPSAVTSFRAEAREGAIRLDWIVPADSAYLFAQVHYIDLKKGEDVVKNVSVYSDSLVIDGLLARDGEYSFELVTVGVDGGKSDVQTVNCTALPVKPVTTKYTERVKLKRENLSSNCADPDPDQGELAALIDENGDTFFHSNWHTTVPYPQWIQMELPEPLDQFGFRTQNRKAGDGYPDWIIIQGSHDGQTWNDLLELDGGLPTTSGGKYESEVIRTDQPYSKLRYLVKRSWGEKEWFHLAELQIDKVWFDIYDPENE